MSDSAPPPPPAGGSESADAGKAKKPWWKRWWGITFIVVFALVALGGLVSEPAEESIDTAEAATPTASDPTEAMATTAPPSTEDAAESDPEPTPEPTPEPEPTTEPEPTPTPAGPEPVFGSGTVVVGEDVSAGTYRSDGQTTLCYWARLADFSGEFDAINANGNLAPAIVEIAEDDAGFESNGCGDWYELSDTYPEDPATEITDGMFEVGTHIAAGQWRADGDSDLCYWQRSSDFSGSFDAIIANGNSAGVVDIAEGDAGFTTNGCGTWTLVE